MLDLKEHGGVRIVEPATFARVLAPVISQCPQYGPGTACPETG